MTGQELIDYIQEGKLQDKHFFIDVEGYFSPIEKIMQNDNEDVILAQEGSGKDDWKLDINNLENYFSEWFDIIDIYEAQAMWNNNKDFLVLRYDGTECYASDFDSFEEIKATYNNAILGIEKE